MTLLKIEKGSGSIAFISYAMVLLVLGLERALLKTAGEDPFGRKLQDVGLIVKKSAKKEHRMTSRMVYTLYFKNKKTLFN